MGPHHAQAVKLRDFILRGGFFMGDDFWGPSQWKTFEASMSRVFPDLFHWICPTLADLSHGLRSAKPLSGARRALLETGV